MTHRSKSKVVQVTSVSVVDTTTGEVIKNTEAKTMAREVEPQFVKLYFEDIGRLNDVPPYVMKVLNALVRSMGYKNVVPMFRPVKEMICKELDMPLNSFNSAVKILAKQGLLIPLNPEKGRGLYLVDPNLFGRGGWADVKKLRMSIIYEGNTRRIETEVVRQLEMDFVPITSENN